MLHRGFLELSSIPDSLHFMLQLCFPLTGEYHLCCHNMPLFPVSCRMSPKLFAYYMILH